MYNETQLLIENFLADNTTLRLNTLNEAMEMDTARELIDKIFALTVVKYNKIKFGENFGEIDKSRGDFTKLKYYKNLIECIETLKQINEVTHQLNDIPIVEKAIANMIACRPEFISSYRLNYAEGQMFYNLVSYAIMETVSYTAASAINFVKSDSNEIVVSDASTLKVFVDTLNKFNETIEDGKFKTFMNIAAEAPQNEAVGPLGNLVTRIGSGISRVLGNNTLVRGVAIGVVVIAALVVIVPLIRNITYFIFNLRHNISEAAQVQAALLEMNIQILKEENGDTKVIARQERAVKFFKRISEKFRLESEKAEHDSGKMQKAEKSDVDIFI